MSREPRESVVQRILFIVTGPKTEDIYVDKRVYDDNSAAVHCHGTNS